MSKFALAVVGMLCLCSCMDERESYVQEQIEFCTGWTRHCLKDYGGHHFKTATFGNPSSDCYNCNVTATQWHLYGPAVMEILRKENE